jgi:hypothetical protein
MRISDIVNRYASSKIGYPNKITPVAKIDKSKDKNSDKKNDKQDSKKKIDILV